MSTTRSAARPVGRRRARPCGRAPRRPRRARRAAVACAPSAAANSTRPGASGSASSRPSCVDVSATRSAPPNASAVACPIAATSRRRAAHPAPQLARAVRARQDDPVVAVDVDRVVAERLDRDERHVGDLVPERSEALDERALLPGGARDDDARHGPVSSPSRSPHPPAGTGTVWADGVPRSVPSVGRLCDGAAGESAADTGRRRAVIARAMRARGRAPRGRRPARRSTHFRPRPRRAP